MKVKNFSDGKKVIKAQIQIKFSGALSAEQTTASYSILQHPTASYSILQHPTASYRSLQESKGVNSILQNPREAYRSQKESTGANISEQQTTEAYRSLQERTGAYRRVQGSTEAYRGRPPRSEENDALQRTPRGYSRATLARESAEDDEDNRGRESADGGVFFSHADCPWFFIYYYQ